MTMPRLHSMRTRIKICGLTRIEDVRDCAQLGVDALGFVFYPPSKRFVSAFIVWNAFLKSLQGWSTKLGYSR